MNIPFESIPELTDNKETLNPTAVISRNLKIQRGMNVFSDEQRTFPVFNEFPDNESLINALKKLNTETYGIINDDAVTVFERGNPNQISTTNYSNQSN